MAKKKEHFLGTGECLIHTKRESKCGIAPCAYQDVTDNTAQVFDPKNAHHIIPVTTFLEYQVLDEYDAKITIIDAAYRNTKYCANRAENITWLPKKGAYRAYRKKGGLWPVAWSMDLPCHDWDHPRYNQEVVGELARRIWDKFTKEPPVPHPTPQKILDAFTAIESHFRDQLNKRGKRIYGGTRGAIQAAEETKPNWWFDFSMTEYPRDEPFFDFGKDAGIPAALLR